MDFNLCRMTISMNDKLTREEAEHLAFELLDAKCPAAQGGAAELDLTELGMVVHKLLGQFLRGQISAESFFIRTVQWLEHHVDADVPDLLGTERYMVLRTQPLVQFTSVFSEGAHRHYMATAEEVGG